MPELIHYSTDLLATVIGVQLYLRSKTIDPTNHEQRLFLIVGALIGALFFSRLIAALENPALFFSPPTVSYYFLNKTIIGGIAGGIIGVEITKKILGITTRTGDRVVLPLAVAIIIGRIGCFVLGVADGTVGGPCSYFWCLDQGDGILRHPNSLYEIIFVSLFLAIYYFALHSKPRWLECVLSHPGSLFRIFIVLYFSLRFGIEFLKDTHPLLFGVNSIQLMCLAFVVWYVRDLVYVYRTGVTS